MDAEAMLVILMALLTVTVYGGMAVQFYETQEAYDEHVNRVVQLCQDAYGDQFQALLQPNTIPPTPYVCLLEDGTTRSLEEAVEQLGGR